MKITVLIVDDHTILREGMASLLSGSDDIEVIGMASSGEEAVNLVSELNPNVILMDIVMAGMNGLEATRWVKEQNADVKVVIISSEVTREYVTQGIKCGIDGYLPKDASREDVVQAIRTVAGGAKFFDDAITKLIFEDYYSREKGGARAPGANAGTAGLTRREYELIEQVASGNSNQEAADARFGRVKTVETHKKNILDSLG